MVDAVRPVRPPAPAKLRILATADVLFYEDGIRTVGIDRLISESSVTKATFYKHYRSKDILIVDYVTAKHEKAIAALEALIAGAASATDAITAVGASIAAEVAAPGFRGCAFVNAAAEFSAPNHPVRAIVTDHRDQYTELLASLLKTAGHPAPGDGADDLMLARDGAMCGGYAGDSVAAIAALQRVIARVIEACR